MKSCKLRMRVKFNILVPTNIFHWFPASPTYSHLGTVSLSHGQYNAWVYLLSTYRCGIRILSGMESGWCRLHCKPFSGVQLVELWYRVLEALLYLLLTRFIWSSHADLSGSGPHKLIALSYTLNRHSPLAAVSRSTSIISLRLGSSASLSSPFSSSCYVGSHCSAFLSC